MNVYGSHMGFIWESYANRPAWSVGLFDPEADAAYAQAGGAGARPGGVFRKRRFPERILKRGDGPRHSGGRRPITRPAINVPKPNAIDGYRRSWMPTRWLKCCPIFEATRSASIRSFSSSPRSDAVTWTYSFSAFVSVIVFSSGLSMPRRSKAVVSANTRGRVVRCCASRHMLAVRTLRSCSVCEYCAPSVMPASVSVVSCEVLHGSTKMWICG